MNVKIGDTVEAIFRKYGKHHIVGEVFEICTDEHSLPGTWVALRVIGGDLQDKTVRLMVNFGNYNVLIPIKDITKSLITA